MRHKTWPLEIKQTKIMTHNLSFRVLFRVSFLLRSVFITSCLTFWYFWRKRRVLLVFGGIVCSRPSSFYSICGHTTIAVLNRSFVFSLIFHTFFQQNSPKIPVENEYAMSIKFVIRTLCRVTICLQAKGLDVFDLDVLWLFISADVQWKWKIRNSSQQF